MLLSVPEVQKWLGREASHILSKQLSSRVHIGRVEISLPNRVVVDSLYLWDRNDSLLLSVRRAGAKMEWTPLLTENRISIANAQLMGAGAHIYQGPDSLYNIQFLIDTFSSKDTLNRRPLDLRIGSLIIRRSNVVFNDIAISDINLTAHLHRLTDDSLSLTLKRLSLREGHGLVLHEMAVEGQATRTRLYLDTLSINAQLPSHPRFPENIDLRLSASGNERRIRLHRLEAHSPLYTVSFLANGFIDDVLSHPSFVLLIDRLSATDLPDRLQALGKVDVKGSLHSNLHDHQVDISTSTALGRFSLIGSLKDNNDFTASLTTDTLLLSPLTRGTGAASLHRSMARLEAKGKIKGADGLPQLTANLSAPLVQFSGYTLRDLSAQASRTRHDTEISLALNDPHGALTAQLNIPGDRWQQTAADIMVDNFQWNREGDEILMQPTDLHITHKYYENAHHLLLNSKDIQLQATGQLEDSIDFALTFMDTLLVRKFAGIDLRIPQQGILVGTFSPAPRFDWLKSRLRAQLEVPQVSYGKETLSNTQLQLNYAPDDLKGTLYTEREMPSGSTAFDLSVENSEDRLHALFSWNNNNGPRQQGTVDATALLNRDSLGKSDFRLWVAPSELVISDSVWQVHPGAVRWHEGVAEVDGLGVSQNDRHLTVNGRVSKDPADTLRASFRDVNVGYIMDLVKFHSVLFGGNASGEAILTGLMSNPVADARAHVTDFTFNNTPEGTVDARLVWGRTPGTLDIEGHVYDEAEGMDTYVSGLVVPGKRPDSRLHLDIDTKHFDLGFLNYFTEGILGDLRGHVSGKAFVGGPMGKINLAGRLHLEDLSVYVPYTGVRYLMAGIGEDSVLLEPNHIYLRNAHIMDVHGELASDIHNGLLQGHMQHDCFKNLRYDFSLDGSNLLLYDMKTFDDQPFYGTLFSTGNVHLFGGEGKLQVDAAIAPEKGSSLTYNVDTPGGVTNSDFITYVDRAVVDSLRHTEDVSVTSSARDLSKLSTDIRVNIDMDMSPSMRLRLLMNRKSDDLIDIGGEGRLLANFHNKGRFNLYGTFTIVDGIYNLSFQEIIRKNFTFRPGGTVSFAGPPLNAVLNLQAAYTVPNVSLNDLGSSSLGFNNTRVDCLMNVTGRAASPVITFDFDLPNATEDEKRIVHSMVSTEEERNMQVIYLLGVGRFYSYQAQAQQGTAGQTGTAMYSFMASTLSQRFNKLLGSAIGSNNWNFGANVRTGSTGWDNVDVEGMLSGRLFDNRLLVNGNFGYRESYYTTRNIITDVDVQYLLTRNGSIAIKGYNKTNDRYFVQNSFNTQGIGIQFQKEFNRFNQLFRRTRRTPAKAKAKTQRETETTTDSESKESAQP